MLRIVSLFSSLHASQHIGFVLSGPAFNYKAILPLLLWHFKENKPQKTQTLHINGCSNVFNRATCVGCLKLQPEMLTSFCNVFVLVRVLHFSPP